MQNKNYRLLKDLPFAKAGEIFESRILDDGKEYMFWGEIKTQNIKNFDDWFEETKEPELPEEFFHINIDKVIGYSYSSMDENTRQEYIRFMERYKSVGNFFETEEETEKRIEYLKAKEVIKQDAKGFKPDWSNEEQPKYYGYCHAESKKLWRGVEYTEKRSTIYFKSIKDIEESLDNRPEEWKTYLTYEQ